MQIRIIRFIFIAFITLIITGPVQANNNLMVILDASGSMWGQVDGVNKIVIAKDVLADMINDLPDDQQIGLVAYGHREKGDCNDVEELFPLGPIDKAAMVARIGKINPRGKTPISRSVRMTAESLTDVGGESTILLVSDGKETCDDDPCALVKALKESGSTFKLHVIGFDVTEEETAQLQCMAEAGGGEYYSAGNADEFRMATEAVFEKEEVPVGTLQITALKDGEPCLAFVYVPHPDGNGYLTVVNTSTDPKLPKQIELPPGSYDVRVVDESVPHEPEKWLRGVEIKLNEVTEHTVEFDQTGVLEITTTRDGEQFVSFVRVFKPGEEDHLVYDHARKTAPAQFTLVPGTYDVTAQNPNVPEKPTITLTGVEVVAGDTTRHTIEFAGEGFLEVSAIKAGQPCLANVKVHNAGEEDYLTYGHARERGPETFKLLPGLYDVYVTDQSVPDKPVVKLENVEVKAGETTKETVEFVAQGVLEIQALKAGEVFKSYVTVHRAGEEDYLVYGHTRPNRPEEFELLPGLYDVNITDQAVPEKPVVTIPNVEVKSGERTVETAEFVPEGILAVTTLKGGEGVTGTVNVYREGETDYLAYDHSRNGKPTDLKLLPGTYWIKAKHQKEKIEKDVTGIVIKSGETTTVTVEF